MLSKSAGSTNSHDILRRNILYSLKFDDNTCIECVYLVDFIQECTGCGECIFEGENIWTLLGGGHTQSDCLAACREKPKCNYASLSDAGYCHMTETCYNCCVPGNDWTRFRKRGT